MASVQPFTTPSVWMPDSVKSKQPTKMKTTYMTANGNEYPIWKEAGTGKYYIVDKKGKISYFSNPNAIKLINQNKAWCISKESYEKPTTTTSNNTNKTNTTTTTTTTSTPTYTGGGGGGGADTPKFDAYIDWLQKKNEELDKRIYELEHPKVLTADELAAFHDIDYNEQHILDEYNERTNQYYKDAIDEYYNLRNNLVGQASRNNQRTVNDYLGEWANAAPTAARRGELAANALSAYMNANYGLNAEDYALNQAQNGLRSEWDAELAANPNTARQQYNAMGTTLASLSANLNTSQVKQYIDQLDAYSQMYAANRAVSAAAAQGVASQYAGLANAAATNADASARRYDSWEQLYNYYRNAYGIDPRQNSTALTNEILNSAGKNQNT